MEKTLIILKPDCLERKLSNTVTSCLLNNDLEMVESKHFKPSLKQMREHYKDIIEKAEFDFESKMKTSFEDKYITAMIIKGNKAIERTRKIIGATEPIKAERTSIRGMFGKNDSFELAEVDNRLVNNLIHASDSKESAEREMNLWFGKK